MSTPRGEASSPEITAALEAWAGGDAAAAERILPELYAELRRQAARAMQRESPEHTLQATALVHEAWLRLAGQRHVAWKGRAHFLGIAGQLMRRILVDHARARHAATRAGGTRVTLGDVAAAEEAGLDVLALDDALQRLAALDPEQARLVELRYFAGLSIEETAQALDCSPATVKREWAIARAWLRRELGEA